MSTKWNSKNRHKYLLQYHIIFVCKYRKKLLVSKEISDAIKQLSFEICQKHNISIKYMETDKDHIHYMIETEARLSIWWRAIQHIIYGKYISLSYPSIFGKNIHFGQMDILLAVLVMCQRKCSKTILRTKVKVVTANVKGIQV